MRIYLLEAKKTFCDSCGWLKWCYKIEVEDEKSNKILYSLHLCEECFSEYKENYLFEKNNLQFFGSFLENNE